MSPVVASLARRYAAWRVGRDLDGLHVAGLESLRRRLAEGPVLVVANHVAWWDGIVALALGQALGAEVGLVARGATLELHPWMGAVGAFPLRDGLRMRASLRAAGEFLDRPGRMLWFFPQGRQRPETVRPLGFQPGVGAFARMIGAPVVPVSLAYPFREVEVPAAALVVHPLSPSVDPAALEDTVLSGLLTIARWADGAGADLTQLLPSRRRPQQAGPGARLLTQVFR